MTSHVLILILTSVGMTSLAQIVLKAGMNNSAVQQALQASPGWHTAVAVVGQPLVMTGLAIYFAAAFVWLLVLARVEVSLAYPFVGLGFIVTMLLAWAIHGDNLSPARIAGTLIIAAGVAVLSRS